MEYDLELGKVIAEIRKQDAKAVCIQLPDGLKPSAGMIKTELEKETDADIIIWLGSCFGACDLPLGAKELDVDLLVQFGHSEWKY